MRISSPTSVLYWVWFAPIATVCLSSCITRGAVGTHAQWNKPTVGSKAKAYMNRLIYKNRLFMNLFRTSFVGKVGLKQDLVEPS